MAEVETAPPEIAAPEAISSAVEPTQDTPRTEPVDAPSAAAPFEAPIIAKKKLFIPETAEFVRAKNYLGSKVGVKHPVSLYDHLAGIVQSVLELRPTNAVDQFESLSLKLKRANVTGGLDTLRVNEPKEPHFELARAESDMKLLVVFSINAESEYRRRGGDWRDP